MDNIPVHKVAGVREAIDAKSAGVLYFPDFNPIEKSFSKINSILQRTTDGHRWRSAPKLHTRRIHLQTLDKRAQHIRNSIRSTKCRD